MLGVVDRAGATQVGNVRRLNEDSYLIREPLFMVADGMGGAQAGEIASSMTAEEFAQTSLRDPHGEETLREVVILANRRIHQRALEDSEVAGMGTTVIAALVDEQNHIAFAHVGDSRAYLLRNGELTRLSNDHSLVGELVRQGELTEAEAEHHPQRSVITRALGAEADVQVDTFSVDAADDDVIMICSDGLTTMIDEQFIREILISNRDATAAADALITAALAAGGEDNVTVIVFRIGEVDEEEAQTPGDHVLPAHVWRGGAAAAEDEPGNGHGGLRLVLGGLATVVVVLVVAGAALAGLRWSHFVGANQATGKVAVYQGVPLELPFGIKLYRETFESGLQYRVLTQAQRKHLFDHRLRSSSDAHAAVQQLESSS